MQLHKDCICTERSGAIRKRRRSPHRVAMLGGRETYGHRDGIRERERKMTCGDLQCDKNSCAQVVSFRRPFPVSLSHALGESDWADHEAFKTDETLVH